MATGKRFYWIKLKESFLTSETVDFLMSQEGGANYVVLYQMLCLKTLNTNGRLERQIGEIIIPFDAEKIQRDCKWFTIDTVRVALELYKKLGLVYVDDNGILSLANYENLVGSETDYAEQKRKQIASKNNNGNHERNNALPSVEQTVEASVENGVEIFHTDIRDKILDTRDKILDNRVSISTVSKETVCSTANVELVISQWNSLEEYGIKPISRISPSSKRYDCLRARLKEYGLNGVLEAIRKVEASDFLKGHTKANFVITFDWFVLPNNFPKVLEGNYDNRKMPEYNNGKRGTSTADMMIDMYNRGEFGNDS